MSRLLRVSDAVSRTGLSERLLRRAIAQGRLRVVRPTGVRAVLPFGPYQGRSQAVVTEDKHGRQVFLTLNVEAVPPDDQWSDD